MATSGLFAKVDGRIYQNVEIPNLSTGGVWPSLVDIYEPDRAITSVLIILHGGGGDKISIMRSMGLLKGPVPLARKVRWYPLMATGAVIVVPNGQAASGQTNAWNPQGIDSRTPERPDGLRGWTNGDMWTGQDDLTYLDELGSYLQSRYDVAGCNLAGFSMGGIMVQRMYREASHLHTNWRRFISLSGPLSADLTGPQVTLIRRPFLQMYGALDDRLDTIGVLYEDFWQSDTASITFVRPMGPLRVGAFAGLQAVVDAYNTNNSNPPETVVQGDGVVDVMNLGERTRWTYGGGKIQLEYFSESSHKPYTFAQATLQRVPSYWLSWIASTPV